MVKHWIGLSVGSIAFVAASLSFAADTALNKDAIVATHNKARAEVGVAAMKWSDALQQKAEAWAAELKNTNNCSMKHSGPGENLFWGGASKSATSKDANGNWIWQESVQNVSEEMAVNSWVSEKQWFNYADNTCKAPAGKACGHYTQVVWKNSTEVGCGKAICDNKTQVWVCNYSPAGNIVGQKPY